MYSELNPSPQLNLILPGVLLTGYLEYLIQQYYTKDAAQLTSRQHHHALRPSAERLPALFSVMLNIFQILLM